MSTSNVLSNTGLSPATAAEIFTRPQNVTPSGMQKTFGSIQEMDSHLRDYGAKATDKYRAEFTADGAAKEISVNDLKDMIKKKFPSYTLTNKEPTDAVKGKNLLNIDDNNMNKMAKDPEYRARVMGLMDRELQGLGEIKFESANNKTTLRTTGSYFSLSDKNSVEDGIPYVGGATSESFSETTSSEQPSSPSIAQAKGSSSKPTASELRQQLLDKLQKQHDELAAEEKRRAVREAEADTSSGVDIVV